MPILCFGIRKTLLFIVHYEIMVIQKFSGGLGGIFMAPRLIYNKYYLLSL